MKLALGTWNYLSNIAWLDKSFFALLMNEFADDFPDPLPIMGQWEWTVTLHVPAQKVNLLVLDDRMTLFSSPATLLPLEIHESTLPESNIPPELNSLSLTPQLLTEEVEQGIQVAFEIHLEEIQEIDQSHALDLQYTNQMQTLYLKSEGSNDGNGCCYGSH